MKIRIDQLPSHLKPLKPIYLIASDEPLQQIEAVDQVRAAARNQGFTERELFHAETSFDWDLLLESANALSLFADRKLIELRIPNGKPGEKGNKALEAYCQNPSPDNILLVITPKLDGAIQRSKWFKKLDQLGIFLPIWPVEPSRLPNWLKQRFQQAGLSASPEAIELLTDRIEGNLLAASQEIEKLKLLAIDGKVTATHITDSVSDSARYDVFGLVDAALQGDIRHCLRIISGLKAEASETTLILWALTREVRNLSEFSYLVHQGNSVDQVCKQLKIWPKRKPLIQQAARRHREKDFRSMLQHAAEIDTAIKGLIKENVWDELTQLTLKLAGAQI
ncbi:DNA polymerase III subunit delta [Endozoicomonas sp. SM1973]|uniref:DNA polymerase III subunit delta n=1 Tax=Spartinivicinus marinus TaxID=2994442 RepID=A0A853IEH9_9GAMM|nr:DNA polymerase III subunit delta [Spartinivicinus marinus]MCX4026007.1 DNA polymerase III subunit delta [Spartinivicinus marinus]NYZ67907.1 DNA polymerase III subunit delta [Spartinivicinus marinus]